MDFQNQIMQQLAVLVGGDPYETNFLLAVSGGKDSMALLNSFLELELDIKVAHFNYQLRGKESYEDEVLVQQFCNENDLQLYCATKDTAFYADSNKLSIQDAARNLRYNWFKQLIEKEKIEWIVTAHHANDSIETFFINLLRGAGIKGLSGIPEKNDKIIRPFLHFDRSTIDAYVTKNKVNYREDSSNATLKYKRNFIRHQIITKLKELDENAPNSILHSISLLNQANSYLENKLNEDINKLVLEKNECIRIDISKPIDDIVLFSIVKKYEFNSDQAKAIQHSINSVGAKFYSKSFELLIDRNEILIKKKQSEKELIFSIPSEGVYKEPISISFEQVAIPQTLSSTKNNVFLDAEKLIFPLEIRKWKEGDWFIPLGMTGKKKLSDFLIDNKISRFEKDQTWVLLSDHKIVWVINQRLDDRFKIDSSTKKVIRVVTEN